MISKANMYKDVILRTTRDGINRTMALSTLWINVALPAILYGVEAVSVSEHLIQQLDLIQTKFGKSELKTLEWWISGLILDPLFLIISRLT